MVAQYKIRLLMVTTEKKIHLLSTSNELLDAEQRVIKKRNFYRT